MHLHLAKGKKMNYIPRLPALLRTVISARLAAFPADSIAARRNFDVICKEVSGAQGITDPTRFPKEALELVYSRLWAIDLEIVDTGS